MRLDDVEQVMVAKVKGADNLHRLSLGSELDFFVLFSSISSVWGSTGLAHYAAANAYLDQMTKERHRMGLVAQTLNWGPWSDAGMAASEDAQLAVSQSGLRSIPVDVGCKFLLHAIAEPQLHQVIVEADWQEFAPLLSLRKPLPLLDDLLSTPQGGSERKSIDCELVNQLRSIVGKEQEKKRHQFIVNYLKGCVSELTENTDLSALHQQAPLMDLGIDSIMAIKLKNQLERDTALSVPATLIFDYPTLDAISEYLLDRLTDVEVDEKDSSPDQNEECDASEAIAIVGIGSVFPGAENSPLQYWKNLVEGVDSVIDESRERWDLDRYLDTSNRTSGKAYSLAGGLLPKERVQNFDSKFFGLAPREIELMDPQQRLALEVAWGALESAGYASEQMKKTKTGVFFGIAANEYAKQFDNSVCDENLMYVPTGSASNMIPGRISYLFGLQGPSIAVDTACSSSAVAVHLACQSLRNGESDYAIAGGVNVMLLEQTYVALCKAQMLSPSGRCRTFDKDADGYVRGEGAGAILLKRLSDAQSDSDNILAVIKGSAVNQDGRSASLTAPNGVAQQDVINLALRNANVAPENLDWVETHGTGTPLGDPIELQSLVHCYRDENTSAPPLWVSSVKTNIGHLESASGIASIIKATLALHHKKIPAHLHFSDLNPNIDVDHTKFAIPCETVEWEPRECCRHAAVSSFGFSGTNAHIVLAEAPNENGFSDNKLSAALPCHLFVLSAKSQNALLNSVKDYLAWLPDQKDIDLGALCHTLLSRRDHFDFRLALSVTSLEDLQSQLQKVDNGKLKQAVNTHSSGVGTYQREETAAWLFSGQGSQYVGMAKQLYDNEPVFRQAMNELEDIFQEYLGSNLTDLLWGDSGAQLNLTQYTQPAIFSLQVALTRLWDSRGITPSFVSGHSIGEFAAAVYSEVISLTDAARIVAARGCLMAQMVESGSMAAVKTTADNMERIIQENALDLSIAAVNGQQDVVISGADAQVDRAISLLEKADIVAIQLSVSHAFHSSMMDPMLESFREAFDGVTLSPPQLPFISGMTGKRVSEELCDIDYWVDHVAFTVNFHQAIETLLDVGAESFLEIGPGNTLINLVRRVSSDKLLVPSLLPRQCALKTNFDALGGLYLGGFNAKWSEVLPEKLRCSFLPGYAFERQRFWVEGNRLSNNANLMSTEETSLLLGAKKEIPGSRSAFFENVIDQNQPFNLYDHKLYGAVVAPGAYHIAQLLVAAKEHFKTSKLALSNVVFPEPMLFSEEKDRAIHYRLEEDQVNQFYAVQAFSRPSQSESNQDWVLHSSVELRTIDHGMMTENRMNDLRSFIEDASQIIEGKEFYEKLWQFGYQLGDDFRWIEKAWRKPGEAITQLRVPRDHARDLGYLIAPGLMDSCFQSSLMASHFEHLNFEEMAAIYIPFAVDNLKFYKAPTTMLWCHVVDRSNSKETDLESYSHKICVYDENGQLIIDIDLLHSKRAPKEALLRSLNKASQSDNVYYNVQWQEQAFGDKTLELSKRQWVVFDFDSQNRYQDLTRALVESQLQLKYVSHNYASDLEGMGELVNAYSIQNTRVDLVVFLPEYVDSAIKHKSVIDLEAGSFIEHIIRSLLKLVMTIREQSWQQQPHLWVVTQNAQVVKPHEALLDPSLYSVWGLAKVLATECPEILCHFIDVDTLSGEQAITTLLNIFNEDSAENQVALRNDERWVARLSPQNISESLEQNKSIPPAPYRAIIEEKGIFENISYQPFIRRTLEDSEAEIDVMCTGLNFRDVMNVLGVYPGDAGPLGGECVGKISAIGKKVTNVKVGDLVIVGLGAGCLGSQVTLPAQTLIKKPDFMSVCDAATIPVVYTTAYHGLITLANIKPGERVLIHAGAGGVGLAAIYLAQQVGAEVYATASKRKRDYLRSIGVKNVLDSRNFNFADEINVLTNGEGIDVVLNSLAGEFIEKSMSLLRQGGRFIEIGKADIWTQEKARNKFGDIRYEAFDLVTLSLANPMAIPEMLSAMFESFESGELKPLPYVLYDQTQVVDAFRYISQGKQIGKVLVSRQSVQSVNVHDDRTYLVTGGAGGLGLKFVEWLIKKGARHFVLTGRREISADLSEKIRQWEKRGIHVHYTVADVVNREDMAGVFKDIEQNLPPLTGILHLAGVIFDSLIGEQTLKDLPKVLSAKVTGSLILHELSLSNDIDMFVLFSSASALLGSPGQSSYASANAFLDGLAHFRRGKGLAANSINWGPWAEVGMAADDHIEEHASKSGLEYLNTNLGLEKFEEILLLNSVHTGVVGIDWKTMSSQFSLGVPPYFSKLGSGAVAQVDPELARLKKEVIPMLQCAHESERVAALATVIEQQVIRVMGLDVNASIKKDQPLQELGLDSLMAVELRNILSLISGKHLAATLLFNYPTIHSLSQFLIDDIFGPAEILEEPTADPEDVDLDDDESAIDNKSEDELIALLEQELVD